MEFRAPGASSGANPRFGNMGFHCQKPLSAGFASITSFFRILIERIIEENNGESFNKALRIALRGWVHGKYV